MNASYLRRVCRASRRTLFTSRRLHHGKDVSVTVAIVWCFLSALACFALLALLGSPFAQPQLSQEPDWTPPDSFSAKGVAAHPRRAHLSVRLAPSSQLLQTSQDKLDNAGGGNLMAQPLHRRPLTGFDAPVPGKVAPSAVLMDDGPLPGEVTRRTDAVYLSNRPGMIARRMVQDALALADSLVGANASTLDNVQRAFAAVADGRLA
eukprot:CAMPEP_0206312624 /NCGR_PEP_ID=MMETSP0106_2-20121207/14089_1 /ASSEMBLY_ACC=CAM_ASM_000206 /TAXON_ID=81532 /ORGANISM="Acanthoeca-like sp., Strain 10tr" /LENGTH=205 /DNA_ID=CAMNT_0053743937 /DNA_START=341 /DNA_END=955 /DNA_ORIENTATION=+